MLIHGDCLEEMKDIENKSIDMILCDLPYGTTRNKWDSIIPLNLLWIEYERIIKNNGAILLFGDEPFTSELICSNRKIFKQRITWDKDKGGGFLNSHKMLLKQTEDICLFYKKPPTYNPQMTIAPADRIKPKKENAHRGINNNYGNIKEFKNSDNYNNQMRFPTNLIKYSANTAECNSMNRLHPTQKPTELLEWLIKTYTSENETILDNCIGSGTTAVACKNVNRFFIGMEKDETYYNIACKRIM